MATLAFFFALTGVATAGVKYLTATDPIPSTSDLGGSTYGNPLIANGKITTAKFASSAVAPDAAKLGGHEAAEFPRVIAAGSFSVGAGTSVAPQQCLFWEVIDDVRDIGVNPDSDYVLIQPNENVGDTAAISGRFQFFVPGLTLSALFCNSRDLVSQDISGTYHYVILR
jgi:hypothetical protein